MAGNWEGFSEEDIGYYLNGAPKPPANEATAKNIGYTKSRHANRTKRLPQSLTNNISMAVPEAALLLKPQEAKKAEAAISTEIELPILESQNDPKVITNSTTPVVQLPISDEVPTENQVLVPESPVRTLLLEKMNHEVTHIVPETLETFQLKQKLLEEQNRQRKQLLSKILSDRKKQTTDEARRLQSIQEELHKLDVQLSSDVGILRNEIEVAAMEFGEAQKRFSKADKEYQEAKQNVFTKLDRKELLTKHLCTIIEQNEIRKAQKLSELMDKLTLEHPDLNKTLNQDTVISSVTRTSSTVDNTSAAQTEENSSTNDKEMKNST